MVKTLLKFQQHLLKMLWQKHSRVNIKYFR
jgi:hypothetical protein